MLQDAAIEDVDETGWGAPEHLWFVRSIRFDLLAPFLADRHVELVTWCSGLAAVAAGRRWSVTGDAGGRLEVDSVWIHLDSTGRPARIEGFGVYAAATGGRPVSTRLTLAEPAEPDLVVPWPLRATDVDRHGHVNNAVHWQAVEQALAGGEPTAGCPCVRGSTIASRSTWANGSSSRSHRTGVHDARTARRRAHEGGGERRAAPARI